MLTMQEISACTGARIDRAQAFQPYLIATMREYGVDTPARAAAFLAQVGHESGGLKYTVEIWGPTMAQSTYERDFDEPWPPTGRGDRNWKAYTLGNEKPGDGYRFRGHGLIQVTGRANHAAARDRMRVRFGIRVPDFEAEPHRLAEHEWAAHSAGDYWAAHNLNALADAGDFVALTRRINGGTNGLEHRQALWATAKVVLA